jgi:hypothetical protein
MHKYRKVLPPSGTDVVIVPEPTTGVTGVGVVVLPVVVARPVQVLEIVLPSIVTAPVCATTLPHPIVAPVSRLTDAYAIIFPTNDVVVPRVAELPTTQSTLSVELPPSMSTLEPLPVMSVLDVTKAMVWLLNPWKLRVRTPPVSRLAAPASYTVMAEPFTVPDAPVARSVCPVRSELKREEAPPRVVMAVTAAVASLWPPAAIAVLVIILFGGAPEKVMVPEPVTAVPGETPRSALRVVAPVLVTVAAPSTEKFHADPRKGSA